MALSVSFLMLTTFFNPEYTYSAPAMENSIRRNTTEAIRKYSPVPQISKHCSFTRVSSSKPRISIIVKGIGLSQVGSQQALDVLPREITLALVANSGSLASWKQKSQQKGHDLVLQIPVHSEIQKYDTKKTGLLLSIDGALFPADSTNILHWISDRCAECVGIIANEEKTFVHSKESTERITRLLNQRGILFLANWSMNNKGSKQTVSISPGIDLILDLQAKATKDRLQQLETIANNKGSAVGVATAIPTSINNIAEWAKGLEERGIDLVPIGALDVY